MSQRLGVDTAQSSASQNDMLSRFLQGQPACGHCSAHCEEPARQRGTNPSLPSDQRSHSSRFCLDLSQASLRHLCDICGAASPQISNHWNKLMGLDGCWGKAGTRAFTAQTRVSRKHGSHWRKFPRLLEKQLESLRQGGMQVTSRKCCPGLCGLEGRRAEAGPTAPLWVLAHEHSFFFLLFKIFLRGEST